MNAHASFSSTSSIAISRSIGQVVAFPVAVKPVAEIEEAIEVAPVAENDNAAPVPFISRNASFERNDLKRALEIVSNSVDKRKTIPILNNVRMIGDGTKVVVTGTDLDIEIQVSIPSACDAGFATTLTAHLFKDLLKKATPSDFVSIDTGEDRDSLDFERVKYQLQPLPVADFPTMRTPSDKAKAFTVPGDVFFQAISGTMGAVSTEETRYYLNGVFFESFLDGNEYKTRMVSTDGHRLYMQEFEAPYGCEDMASIIIPRNTVELLYKLLKGKNCPAEVNVSVDEFLIRISYDDVVISSKTVDGTFPDYRRVIPSYNDRLATMDSKSALEAIRAVSLISSERGRAVKLEFSAGNCRMIVNNPDSGSAVADIKCDYEGDEMEIGFNAGYLSAIIVDAVGNGSNFTMKLSDAGSPAIVTGDQDGWTGVLMPMRV